MAVSDRTRVVYLSLGWFFFGLGFLGAFLPVLPTTPFMLLALWAFGNGSARLHDWLYHHPRFGPALQQWRQHRVVPPRAKLTAIAVMLGSLAYLIWVAEASGPILAASAALMAVGAGFLLSRPSRVPDRD